VSIVHARARHLRRTEANTGLSVRAGANFLAQRDTTNHGELKMAEGTIKRLTDKGFGFIENGSGTDMFFHMSAVEGVRFSDLREGQKVSYNEGRGPKGPRAENVRVIE
jgi:CspA family cold shock protein